MHHSNKHLLSNSSCSSCRLRTNSSPYGPESPAPAAHLQHLQPLTPRKQLQLLSTAHKRMDLCNAPTIAAPETFRHEADSITIPEQATAARKLHLTLEADRQVTTSDITTGKTATNPATAFGSDSPEAIRQEEAILPSSRPRTLNDTPPSPQPCHASYYQNQAGLLTSCTCPQLPLRLERKLSLHDLQKLAVQEAPNWKSAKVHTCPVCFHNVRTYGQICTGLRHLWFHATSDLQLRRCPDNACQYRSSDESTITRHYRQPHGHWTRIVLAASKQTKNIRSYHALLQKLASPKSRVVKRQQPSTTVTADDLAGYVSTSAQRWSPNTPVSCPICKQLLRSYHFRTVVLHLLKHVAPRLQLYHCPATSCTYCTNFMSGMNQHYKRIHGQWTPSIRTLSRNASNYVRYLSLLRLGARIRKQAKHVTCRIHDTDAEQVLRIAPDACRAPSHTSEGNVVRLPFQQEALYNMDELHLDALDELALMEEQPTAPSPSADPHTMCFSTQATLPMARIVTPAPSTPDFTTQLSRFDPDSETFIIFRTYAVFFESMHATPWWISIDTRARQNRFREIFQHTARRQKQNLVIVSCDLQQKQCSNLVQMLRQQLGVTDLMMPNDPTFLQHPEKQDLIQLVNSFPHTLRKVYNLPYSSMLAHEGRKLLGSHEARTVGSPSGHIVDFLFNFAQLEPSSYRLRVTYEHDAHLRRDFKTSTDYTDLEVRMTTTFTQETLTQLLYKVTQLMSTIVTLRTTTVYATHNEPPDATETAQFEASVEHFRSLWNALWTWTTTTPKPCNVCFTYASPLTKPPEPAIEVYGIPHLSPVTPTVYSNVVTSTHGRNIISVLDLTARTPITAAPPTGSPLEQELQSALKCLLDDSFRQQDATTLQPAASIEAEPLQPRMTATTSTQMEPSASTSTANTTERPPPPSDEAVATSSSR